MLKEEPVSPQGNLKRRVTVKMAVLARQIRQLFDERAALKGLTRAEYMLITTAARQPGATQRQIASELEISGVSAGRLIDRLAEAGLLERKAKSRDRRAYSVHLTAAAGPIVDSLSEIVAGYEHDIYVGISTEQLKMLERILDRVASNTYTARKGGSSG